MNDLLGQVMAILTFFACFIGIIKYRKKIFASEPVIREEDLNEKAQEKVRARPMHDLVNDVNQHYCVQRGQSGSCEIRTKPKGTVLGRTNTR